MNHEERFAALEQELKQLRQDFAEATRIHQELGGRSRMYQEALIALVLTHPRPELLKQALDVRLAILDARIVAVAIAEEHLQGSQDAQTELNRAVDDAIRNHLQDKNDERKP